MSAIYDQIKKLTRSERLDLVQEIWVGLAAESDAFEISAVQTAELDRRPAQHPSDAGTVGSLDALAARLGARL